MQDRKMLINAIVEDMESKERELMEWDIAHRNSPKFKDFSPIKGPYLNLARAIAAKDEVNVSSLLEKLCEKVKDCENQQFSDNREKLLELSREDLLPEKIKKELQLKPEWGEYFETKLALFCVEKELKVEKIKVGQYKTQDGKDCKTPDFRVGNCIVECKSSELHKDLDVDLLNKINGGLTEELINLHKQPHCYRRGEFIDIKGLIIKAIGFKEVSRTIRDGCEQVSKFISNNSKSKYNDLLRVIFVDVSSLCFFHDPGSELDVGKRGFWTNSPEIQYLYLDKSLIEPIQRLAENICKHEAAVIVNLHANMKYPGGWEVERLVLYKRKIYVITSSHLVELLRDGEVYVVEKYQLVIYKHADCGTT